VRAVVPPPGEARPDWWIAAAVAQRLGHGAAFAWRDDTEVFREHVALTVARDCDMGGITPERLERAPLQWPCPDAAHAGTARLYTDGRFPTPSGRARFVVPRGLAVVEAPSAERPLALSTVRLRDQWHVRTRPGACRLPATRSEPELEPRRPMRGGSASPTASACASRRRRAASRCPARDRHTVPEARRRADALSDADGRDAPRQRAAAVRRPDLEAARAEARGGARVERVGAAEPRAAARCARAATCRRPRSSARSRPARPASRRSRAAPARARAVVPARRRSTPC
jgi:hypothetical protein